MSSFHSLFRLLRKDFIVPSLFSKLSNVTNLFLFSSASNISSNLDNLMNFINKINADERAVIVTSQGEVDTMEMGLNDNGWEK